MEEILLHCLQPSCKRQHVTIWCEWGPCMGIHRTMPLTDNVKHAMGEGKHDLVETGLMSPAATVLRQTCLLQWVLLLCICP